MNMTIRELRSQTKQAIEMVERGVEVTITKRGRPCAKIVAVATRNERKENPIFGMWKDRTEMKNPSEYVRKLRRGRYAR